MRKLLCLAMFLGSFPFPLDAQPIDWPPYEELALRQLQAYLQIETTNPPGNELAAARFFQEWFTREGIPVEVFEFAPGRANLIARLRGDGSRRPLILLNHMDVVSSDPERWRVPPFSGAVLDGYVYGRGALDMKGEGLLQAVVFVLLHRAKVPLKRDVLFVATADEEVAMQGAQWLIQNHRDLLAQAEYLLTEGGFNLVEDDQVKYIGVDTAEKAPYWLRLRATGKPGHGSRPQRDAASHRLARALARVVDWETPIKILPGVEKFFRDLAPLQTGARAEQLRNLRAAIEDRAFRSWLTGDDMYNYLVRNTISLTVLEGSKQTNVIPGEAIAHLDVRLLPGEDPETFRAELRRVLADDTIAIEPVQQVRAANSSPIDTELFRAIERAAARHAPRTVVTTRMLSGYTESALFRPLGITCYGFSPFLLTREENAATHGDNERISVENVRRGLRLLYDVVEPIVR